MSRVIDASSFLKDPSPQDAEDIRGEYSMIINVLMNLLKTNVDYETREEIGILLKGVRDNSKLADAPPISESTKRLILSLVTTHSKHMEIQEQRKTIPKADDGMPTSGPGSRIEFDDDDSAGAGAGVKPEPPATAPRKTRQRLAPSTDATPQTIGKKRAGETKDRKKTKKKNEKAEVEISGQQITEMILAFEQMLLQKGFPPSYVDGVMTRADELAEQLKKQSKQGDSRSEIMKKLQDLVNQIMISEGAGAPRSGDAEPPRSVPPPPSRFTNNTDDNLDTTGLASKVYNQPPNIPPPNMPPPNIPPPDTPPPDTPPPDIDMDPSNPILSNVTDVSNTIDRENELPDNETAALTYHANFTEMLNVSTSRLLHDKERGNVGAGTHASAPAADLWGILPPPAPQDKQAQPELLFDTKSDGTVVDGDTNTPEPDLFSLLPFAKLAGQIVWIPRHVQASKFFFNATDYEELVSHINDTNPLTLLNEDMVDINMMRDSITRLHTTLNRFCSLDAPLPMSATQQQVYAEWLELRQISRALAMYQQNTAGMYENASISMKGGIRAAVGQALKPLYDKLNIQPPNTLKPLSASMSNKKREMPSVVQDSEYNPQYSYDPISFKRVKFSIPNL